MRRAIFCTSAVLVGLGLLGCGSSGSSTTHSSSVPGITAPTGHTGTTRASGNTGTTTAPAGSSYAARADAICTRYQQQRRSAFRQLAGSFRQRLQGHGGGPGSLAQQAASAYRQAVALGRRQLAELRGLPAPPGQGATVRAYLASLAAVLGDLQTLAGNLAAHGVRGATGGGHLPEDVARSHRLAERLGLKVCGQLR